MQKRKKSPTTSVERALKVITIIARVVVAVAAVVNVTYALHLVLQSRELFFAFSMGVVVTSLLATLTLLWR